MTQPALNTTSVKSLVAGRRPQRNTFLRVIREPLGAISVFILALTLIVGLLAPWIMPHDVSTIDLGNIFKPPGPEFWFGTDSAGRDIFSQLVSSTLLTLAAAMVAVGVGLVIGVPAGLVAGFYGRWFDSISSWFTEMLMALPGIIILLAARAAFGPNLWLAMVVFGVLLSPGFFRLVRTAVITVRGELYVDAARVSGLSDGRIIARHVLTVVRAPIIIQASLVAGIAINVQAGLEFLGVGDPSNPTWGVMLNEAFRNIYVNPIGLLWPAAAISIVTAAFALFGNALRDALEEGEKTKKAKRKTQPRKTPGRRAAASTGAVETSPHLLSVSDLSIEYPRPDGTASRVVDGFSFHVDRGEVLGIVGESGSGKSQTAFAILGLLPSEAVVAEGHIVFDGIELVSSANGAISASRMDPLRGVRIAYIPQEPMSNLDPAYTVGYQLTRPLVKRMGMSRADAKKRALELLATVGIADPERTFRSYPHEISGGMAQRVLIAGAVSCEPDLLIADEPTTALDVTVQAEVLDLLRDLQKRFDMGIVMVTHNFGVVADLCDRVVVLRHSKFIESGEVTQILRHPQDPYTRMLLDSTLEGKEPRTMLLTTDKEGAE
ncbi:dipeptide/oligopeptide/nickel ABC transporter permease/ATP-binding protein [Microbacterium sp. No. 7]|uniref:dipeptide/oligopeptide/nickel ABC transporter permease/ATP-binding protein n=1 Tax=Microbacterium sp. No. 7 TaxID=1714373 RepID=UPI0006D0604F|nr:dipeptide/oligopeptide/nickel ABC transporter permease/ATP-binding protein [Microbacterium sp. No. 7]ALJ20072.1 ABC transporter [Microbacterium sp. No. 7]